MIIIPPLQNATTYAEIPNIIFQNLWQALMIQVKTPTYAHQFWPQFLCAHVLLIPNSPGVSAGSVMSTLALPSLPCPLPCRLVRLDLWLRSVCLLKLIALLSITCPITCRLVRLDLWMRPICFMNSPGVLAGSVFPLPLLPPNPAAPLPHLCLKHCRLVRLDLQV